MRVHILVEIFGLLEYSIVECLTKKEDIIYTPPHNLLPVPSICPAEIFLLVRLSPVWETRGPEPHHRCDDHQTESRPELTEQILNQ